MTLPSEPSPDPTFNPRKRFNAGWSFLVYTLLVGFVFVLLAFIIAPGRNPFTASAVARSEAVGCIAFLIPALLMSRIEQLPFSSYGLAPAHSLRNLLSGLLTGLVFLSALIAVLYLTHHLAFEPHPLLEGPSAILRGTAWLVAFSLVGLQEEFSTRGYLQFTLTRALTGLTRRVYPSCPQPASLAFWISAFILSGLLFMALHLRNGGETRIGILAVGLAGLTFVFSLWRTGSLWWAIGFHTTWDWAQSFLFGVPDSGTLVANHLLASHPLGNPLLSGGTTGPEGSLFVIPTLLLVTLTVHLLYPDRPRIYTRSTA